jgi:hypothetical protein
MATEFAKRGYVTVSINYRLISTPCGGSNLGGTAPWRRSTPGTTARRRSAGCGPTRRSTASTRRGSASAASRRRHHRGAGRACAATTPGPAATPAPPRA